MITPYGSDRGKGVWGKTQLSMEGGGTLLTDHAVKEWLSRYADAAREVALLRARADAIRDRASSPASPILDGMPRAPGFDGDKLGGIIGTVDAIDREADEKAQDAAALNTLDALTLEMRKITDHADKVNRRLVELQYGLVHLLDGKEENK